MKNFKGWSLLGTGVAAIVVQGCGSSGSDGSGEIRLVNATLTHTSIDLVNTSGASKLVSSVPAGTVSSYVGLDSGSATSLQINDAGGATPLVSTTTTVPDGKHYSLVVYESGGTVRTAQIAEDSSDPADGTAQLRIFDPATDAGAIDVYVTTPGASIANVSPSFRLGTSTSLSSGLLSFTPGTYQVRIFGADSKTDLRLDMPSVALGEQQVATIVLTPTVGGVLVDGGNLIQQGTYAQTRNATARVRLAAAAAAGASVDATAGATPLATGAIAPSVGSYATVAANSVIAITVDGTPIAAPAGGLAAGTDSTLLVYDNPAANTRTATLIGDDNHLLSATANYKMRLVNGITGTASTLTLRAGAALLASNVAPGVASSYGTGTGNTSGATTVLQVSSPQNAGLYTSPAQSIFGSAVYTLFMFGTAEATGTYPIFVQDNIATTAQ